jgi:hypothetical protein
MYDEQTHRTAFAHVRKYAIDKMTGFFAKSSRATVVQDVFRRYLECTREFWKVAQRSALKGSPAWKLPLQKAFRLQHVLIDRQALRFGYLLAGNTFDFAGLKSLNDITERLDQRWSEVEEVGLIGSNSFYRDVIQEIKDIQSSWDAKALAEPLQELQKDLKYCDARRALADKVQELDEHLRRH